MRPVFHRDGRVTVQGREVGRWLPPDPSGAPHARSPRWVFIPLDGRTELGRTRADLADAALSASRRLA